MSARIRWTIIASIIGCLLFAGSASSSQPSDAWLTTKVKMALLTADGVDGLAINVDTYDGTITLHGVLESEAEKERAEQAVLDVDEVRAVRNVIAVVPVEDRSAVSMRDEELTREIEGALRRVPELESSTIEIASVHDGIVVLAGRADTLGAHRRALDVAGEVDGVRQVVSEIHSPDVLEDAEIWEDTAASSKRSDSGWYVALADSWITTKAKAKLLTDRGLSPLDIHVDTREGVVTVFGTVETDDAKKAVAATLMDINGVRSVVNGLQVESGATAVSTRDYDEVIRDLVRARLQMRADPDSREIDVEVVNGVVHLSGKVSSREDKLTALSIAREAEGVRYVIDGLTIRAESRG